MASFSPVFLDTKDAPDGEVPLPFRGVCPPGEFSFVLGDGIPVPGEALRLALGDGRREVY